MSELARPNLLITRHDARDNVELSDGSKWRIWPRRHRDHIRLATKYRVLRFQELTTKFAHTFLSIIPTDHSEYAQSKPTNIGLSRKFDGS